MQRRACYLALGITMDGDRDVLGMWFQETEGAKFWMQVLTELKQRGVQDILICCVDGLKGFPEAIEAIFPATTVQTCIVHLIRHITEVRAAPGVRRRRPGPETDLHRDRRRRRARGARGFDEKWGAQFPVISQAWLNSWEYVIPFLAFAPEVRRVIYTTNAIEALNRQLRKAIKTKGNFPNEDAARKLHLPRDPQRRPAMDPNPGLDESATGVQNPLRRPTTQLDHQPRLHRKSELTRTGLKSRACRLALTGR